MRNIVDSVRTAACGWFTTVLGPGADAAHTDHFTLTLCCTEQVIVIASANEILRDHRLKLLLKVK
jgi:hypothetical protein